LNTRFPFRSRRPEFDDRLGKGLGTAITIGIPLGRDPWGDKAKGSADIRRNNLDCLRLILAVNVAFDHGFALRSISASCAFGPPAGLEKNRF
jgi:hypothetical protein